MDWNNNLTTFVPRPQTSLNFLYDYDHHSAMSKVKYAITEEESQEGSSMEKLINYGGHQGKKKRLTSEQLESLERSFQEEIKLEPDRKMKLSRELGLQPRQIAVWFQNRRARWKAKQLERLYDALKVEFDMVSKEKQKLQEEVMKLQSMLREQATRKQLSTGYTDISGEETTVESTSIALHSSTKTRGLMMTSSRQIGECNYLLGSVDECNLTSSPYWAVLPSNYP